MRRPQNSTPNDNHPMLPPPTLPLRLHGHQGRNIRNRAPSTTGPCTTPSKIVLDRVPPLICLSRIRGRLIVSSDRARTSRIAPCSCQIRQRDTRPCRTITAIKPSSSTTMSPSSSPSPATRRPRGRVWWIIWRPVVRGSKIAPVCPRSTPIFAPGLLPGTEPHVEEDEDANQGEAAENGADYEA